MYTPVKIDFWYTFEKRGVGIYFSLDKPEGISSKNSSNRVVEDQEVKLGFFVVDFFVCLDDLYNK